MDPRENTPPPSEGLKAEVTSFLRDASGYLQLRTQLFGIEAKEAGQAYRTKLTLILAGAVLIFLAYLLMVVAAIGIITALIDSETDLSFSNWIGGTLITALIHLLLGLFSYRTGKTITPKEPLFEYTRNELQKEQEWLKQKRKR